MAMALAHLFCANDRTQANAESRNRDSATLIKWGSDLRSGRVGFVDACELLSASAGLTHSAMK
jgi:hypothetical protein